MNTTLDITRALKVSIRRLAKDWRRPPGRPRHIWLRSLEADLQPLNLGLNSAWKYTQDRQHRKHLVETATFQLEACAWWWWWFVHFADVALCVWQTVVTTEQWESMAVSRATQRDQHSTLDVTTHVNCPATLTAVWGTEDMDVKGSGQGHEEVHCR